jgi:ribosomal 50S subunit-associated protein YjgA (DUF615 family)
MSQTLIISDTLYTQLQTTARARGLDSIEELLRQLVEMWQSRVGELRRRQEVVHRIDALRERLFAEYGEMTDSVEWIRADRER